MDILNGDQAQEVTETAEDTTTTVEQPAQPTEQPQTTQPETKPTPSPEVIRDNLTTQLATAGLKKMFEYPEYRENITKVFNELFDSRFCDYITAQPPATPEQTETKREEALKEKGTKDPKDYYNSLFK